MALSFRPAGEEDLERLVDIHATAFPDSRGRVARHKNFSHNPLGALRDLFVAEEGGLALAHGFLFPLEAWFGGRLVKTAGLASIGVAPEARGRGIASRLIEHLHEVARSRGDRIAVLYAFRQSFYERFGYGPASPHRRLRLHPASIPFRAELRPRAAEGSDVPALHECWRLEAQRHNGALARAAASWEARLAEEQRTWIVVEGSAGVEGYVSFTLTQSEQHAEVVLEVKEMASRSIEGARSLWGVLAAQRDQVSEVRVAVSHDDPIDLALVDPDRARHGTQAVEHLLGELAAGPRLRALDVIGGLSARGYATDGAMTLDVDGERLALTVADGLASVEATEAEPSVSLSLPTLSSVAFGGVTVSQGARLGWVKARDARALAVADALFASPPYFSQDAF